MSKVVEAKNEYREFKRKVSPAEIESAEKYIKDHALSISPMSFLFVSMQMRRLGFEGIPYRDRKTFKGWKAEGLYVKRGEKSQISGITWVGVGETDEQEADYKMPHVYYLFHRSQVAA